MYANYKGDKKMAKLCPLNKQNGENFKECLEESCAWYDDETGGCEITNLSLISKMPIEEMHCAI